MIKVAAGILMYRGKILIAQRAEGDRLALKWEFPGGKVEPGETPERCLIREIKEELGLDIQVMKYCATSTFSYAAGTIELIAYYARPVSGELHRNVHNDVRWVELDQLDQYDFAPADLPIVVKVMQRDAPLSL